MLSELKNLHNQKGVTLVELVVSLLVLSLMVIASLRVIEMSFVGNTVSRNALRARDLAEQKLEVMKAVAMNASMDYNFSCLTCLAEVQDYAVTKTATINGKDFIWQVSTAYMAQFNATSITAAVPAAAGNTSSIVRFTAKVTWDDATGPRDMTFTAYVSDIRQYQ